MKAKHKTAIKKYGVTFCLYTLTENEVYGEGANSIAIETGYKTRQIDSAINAGRYLPQVKGR